MNKNVFTNKVVNEAGGSAFKRSAAHELAQLACTGTFHNTFYIDGESQLERVITLANQVDVEFLAKLTIYSRESAGMKDMPATLLAILLSRNVDLFKIVAPSILRKGKMVRNFVQVLRSGKLGRKTIPRPARKYLEEWFQNRDPLYTLNDSVGTSPSIADVIKMVHPSPISKEQESLWGYLLGKEVENLPPIISSLKRFHNGQITIPPPVEFRLLTGNPLSKEAWRQVGLNLPWQALRMNLNTLYRQGVFENSEVTDILAKKLADIQEVREAKVFPYQIMAAYFNIDEGVPKQIRQALEQVMELATDNIPVLEDKKIVVGADTSGSMGKPITGKRDEPSKIRCIDVAALMSSCIARKNPHARIIPFDTSDHSHKVDLHGNIMNNAYALSMLGGGGTYCEIPLQSVNRTGEHVDLMILISDNESWGAGHKTQREWEILKKRCPHAKMINIDITPSTTSQVKEGGDVYNIGGFSDSVFDFIGAIMSGDRNHWLNKINETPLDRG